MAPRKKKHSSDRSCGEIYTVLEPFVNLDVEERLGHLGVEVYRTISLVDWVKNHIFKQGVGLRIDKALRKSAEAIAGFWADMV